MLKFRPTTRAALVALPGLLALAAPSVALAQAQPAAPAAAPPEPPLAPAPEAPVPPKPAEADGGELAKLRAEVEATKKDVEDLRAAQEATEAAAAMDAPAAEQEKLKIYGFADVGFQYVQINKGSLLANAYDVNDPDFVLGNLNLYFDGSPTRRKERLPISEGWEASSRAPAPSRTTRAAQP